jgi:hypothetical protein
MYGFFSFFLNLVYLHHMCIKGPCASDMFFRAFTCCPRFDVMDAKGVMSDWMTFKLE